MGLGKKLRKIIAALSAAALVCTNAPVAWATTASSETVNAQVLIDGAPASSVLADGAVPTITTTVTGVTSGTLQSTDYTVHYEQRTASGVYDKDMQTDSSQIKDAGYYQVEIILTDTQKHTFDTGAEKNFEFAIVPPQPIIAHDSANNTYTISTATHTPTDAVLKYTVDGGMEQTATSGSPITYNTPLDNGSVRAWVEAPDGAAPYPDSGAVSQNNDYNLTGTLTVTTTATTIDYGDDVYTTAEDVQIQFTPNGQQATTLPANAYTVKFSTTGTGGMQHVDSAKNAGEYSVVVSPVNNSGYVFTQDTSQSFTINKDPDPAAPSNGVENDAANTYTFTADPDCTYEYCTNYDAAADVSTLDWKPLNVTIDPNTNTAVIPASILSGSIPAGKLAVRVADTSNHAASAPLVSDEAFIPSLPSGMNVTISGGTIAGATLTASITNPPDAAQFAPAYQWYRRDSAGGQGTMIDGATESTYTTLETDVGKYFYVEVTDKNGNFSEKKTSPELGPMSQKPAVPTLDAITILNPDAASNHTLYLTEGQITAQTLMRANVTMSDPNISQGVKYGWFNSDAAGNKGTPVVNSSDTSTCPVPVALTRGTHYYIAEAYYVSQTIRSGVITIVVNPAATPATYEIKFTHHPATSSIALGTTADLFAQAASDPAGVELTYRWYRSDNPQKTNITDLGVNGQVYSLPTNLANGTYYYFCRAYAKDDTTKYADSNVATITVGSSGAVVTPNELTPVLSPQNPSVGGQITAKLPDATNVTNVTYSWYKVHPTTGLETRIAVSSSDGGQKSNTITLSNVAADISGYRIKVVVTSNDAAHVGKQGVAITTDTVGGTTTGSNIGTGIHALNVNLVAPTELRYSKNNAKTVTAAFTRTNNELGYVAPVLGTDYIITYSGKYYGSDTAVSADAVYGPITTAPINRGNYTATLSLTPAGAAKYTLSGVVSLDFSITQGTITVKPVDLVYYTGSGATFPSPYLSYTDQSGVSYTPSEVLASGSYNASMTATNTTTPGEYPITVTSVGTPTPRANFTLTTTNGTLRIISGTGSTSSGNVNSSTGASYELLINAASSSQQTQLNDAESELVSYLISYGGTSVVYRVYFDIYLRDIYTGNIVTTPNGNVTVTIPYHRIGTGANQYGIYNVIHVRSDGSKEYFLENQITKNSDGISFTVSRFSPFMVLITPRDAYGNIISLGAASDVSGTGTTLGSGLSSSATSFWNKVENTIRNTASGNRVRANAKTYDQVPVSVLNTLRSQPGVTLEITWDGGQSVVIHSSEVITPEVNRVYYPISKLLELYGDGYTTSTPLGSTSNLGNTGNTGATITGSGSGNIWYDNTKPGAVTGGVMDVFAPDLPVLSTFTPTPSTYGFDDTIPTISLRGVQEPGVIPYMAVGLSLLALLGFGAVTILRKRKSSTR